MHTYAHTYIRTCVQERRSVELVYTRVDCADSVQGMLVAGPDCENVVVLDRRKELYAVHHA